MFTSRNTNKTNKTMRIKKLKLTHNQLSNAILEANGIDNLQGYSTSEKKRFVVAVDRMYNAQFKTVTT